MANLTYKALDANKQVTMGSLTAKNRQEAAQILTKRGLSPLVISEIPERSTVKGSLPQIDRITFCRYLATMLASGLSLSEGIDVLREETKQPMMRRILGDMSYSLEQGQQLSSVFERYPNVFEPYFLTLVRAGEVSGKLADIFKYLENELRSEYSLKAHIQGALLYPGVVFTAMLGLGMIMFFFVLPQIGKVFLNLRIQLPLFTKLLFTFSIALSKQFIPITLGLIIGAIGAFFALKRRVVKDAFPELPLPQQLLR